MRIVTVLVALVGCAPSDHGLTALDEPGLVPTDDLGDGAGYAAWESPAAGAPAQDAVELAPHERGPAPRVREEVFALGPTPVPVSDFLFVVDDSISMRNVVAEVRKGARSLRRRNAFPANSRLAVMHTTPADVVDRDLPHLSAWNDEAAHLEPGFLGLVSGPGIEAYRAVASPGAARRWFRPGCDAWFTPDARNAVGRRCLAAHMTTPRLRGGGDGLGRAEAGLVALRQWLEDTDGTPRFRAGAAVNVVFISDTHDPGLGTHARERRPDWAAELDAERPDFAELDALVDDPVAAFRVHAIAPAEGADCGEDFVAPTYFDVVGDAGGEQADICTTTDYAAVIDRIVKSGSKRQRPVLRLGYPASGIQAVTVDGADADWSFTPDPQAIRVHVESAGSVRQVAVRYVPR